MALFCIVAVLPTPVASADGPLICKGQVALDCGVPTGPCDVVGGQGEPKDLCGIGWFGCQYDWKHCILEPLLLCKDRPITECLRS